MINHQLKQPMPSMWVIVRGGLGNQMFQVACATALAQRFSVQPRYVDLSGRARVARRWELGCFDIQAAPTSHFQRLLLGANAQLAQRLTRLGPLAQPGGSLVESPQLGRPPVLQKAPRLISGYWQDERFFKSSAAAVRRLFTLPTRDWSPGPSEEQSGCPVVAIHVRRGDYVSDPVARKVHLVCDQKWYRRAWEAMRATMPMARALVFSDDLDWARTQLALDGQVDYVAGTPDAPAWVDLARMAQCQHFVISNSSYSWWAAWLGMDPGKKVIAPRYWFHGQETAALGICPSHWNLL